MTFAPVGIRCPDHANVGALKPSPARTVRTAQRRVRRTRRRRRSRSSRSTSSSTSSRPPRAHGINTPGGKLFNNWALVGALVDQGDWWRLVTAMFLHAGVTHLAFNMFALYWLGSVVEQASGRATTSCSYFVSGLAGSAGALVFSNPPGNDGRRLGRHFRRPGRAADSHSRTRSRPPAHSPVRHDALIVTQPGDHVRDPAGISKGGHLGGLIGGIPHRAGARRGPAAPVSPDSGSALVRSPVAVGSVVLAYMRVSSYGPYSARLDSAADRGAVTLPRRAPPVPRPGGRGGRDRASS